MIGCLANLLGGYLAGWLASWLAAYLLAWQTKVVALQTSLVVA